MPSISVILCTYNRAENLKDTLLALKKQDIRSSKLSLEILVIDNNSKDHTKEVVLHESTDSPYPIRYVFESSQGKSFALNRGIQEASGDLLLFTDDDIVPPTNWVSTMNEACVEYHADCFGGKVLPLWLDTPPDWITSQTLKRNVNGILAMLDYGDSVITATPGSDENFLFGCNIGFRKEVFNEVGLYRTDIGPTAGKLSRGEDTEMMKRVLTAGKKAVYVPSIHVLHKVEKERMTLKYARKRRFDGGVSDYQRLVTNKKRIPLWYYRECIQLLLTAWWLYLRGKIEIAIDRELGFWNHLGRIVGAHQK